MTFTARVRVTLRPSILDPQGKAALHALHQLGFGEVADVRVGKFIELRIEADSETSAARVATESCAKLLANPIIEDFAFDLEVAQSTGA